MFSGENTQTQVNQLAGQITVYATVLLGRQNIKRRGYQAPYIYCKILTRDSSASYISLIFFLSDESLAFKFSDVLSLTFYPILGCMAAYTVIC